MVAALVAGLGLAYQYDFFHRGAAAVPRTISPGEAAVVGVVEALGMAGLAAWRKAEAQREELRRQQREEIAVRFETALHKFVTRHPGEPKPDEEHEDLETKI